MMRSSNPIYDHLTRHRRPPSVRLTVLIFGAASLVLTVTDLNLVAQGWGSSALNIGITALPLITMFLSLIVFLLSPFLAATLSAIYTVNAVSDEAFVLLRLSGVPPKRMVRGFLFAAVFRLRLLWGVCYGLLLPLLASFSIDWSMSALTRPSQRFDYFIDYILPVILIVVIGALLGTVMNALAVALAVRSGLRSRSLATTIGEAVGGAFAQLVGLLIVLYFSIAIAIELGSVIGMLPLITLFTSILVWLAVETVVGAEESI